MKIKRESNGEDVGDAWVVMTAQEAYDLMIGLQCYFANTDQQVAGWHDHIGGPRIVGDDNAELTIEIVPDVSEPPST